MLVSTGTASSKRTNGAADEAILLEALAEAGDALTAALVARDLHAITAATRDAETLVVRLDRLQGDTAARRLARDEYAIIAMRLGISARRNAVLLESAWTTDAAVLRLLAAAALESGPGHAPYTGTPAGTSPAGWLDRSA